MKWHVFTIVVLVIISFIFACQSDDGVTPEPPANFLVKIEVDSTLKAQLYYDKKKRVSRVDEYDTENKKQYFLTTYNSENKNTLIKYFDSTQTQALRWVEVDYNPSGLIYKLTYWSNAGERFYKITFDYSEEKKVTKEFHYTVEDSVTTMTRYYTFTYNSMGNVEVQREYLTSPYQLEAKLSKIITYEYDSKPNPYKQISFLYGYNSYSTNNIIKATVKNAIGDLLEETYNSEYEYNEDTYPTLENRLYLRDADPHVYKYEYIKEAPSGDLPVQNEPEN